MGVSGSFLAFVAFLDGDLGVFLAGDFLGDAAPFFAGFFFLSSSESSDEEELESEPEEDESESEELEELESESESESESEEEEESESEDSLSRFTGFFFTGEGAGFLARGDDVSFFS